MAIRPLDPAEPSAPRIDLELTTACDHRCGHCYNVWNDEQRADAYPRGQLPTPDLVALLERVVAQSGARHVTITGGEPLLHHEADAIIERACALVPSVQLITNGAHLPPERAARLARAGVSSVQLTLLAGDRARHDRLKGAESFDATLRAALDLRDAGVAVQICFVATRDNAGELGRVLELCCVLGVRALAYNRMSPAGSSARRIAELVPDAAQVEADLDVAERFGQRFRVHVSTAMPIPPCLVRTGRYRWIRFGYCSLGTSAPSPVIDPLGNVRSCNLSREILGNAAAEPWPQIIARYRRRNAGRSAPPLCRGCIHERTCRGGCPESALAAFGSSAELDPFLRLAVDARWRASIGRDAA